MDNDSPVETNDKSVYGCVWGVLIQLGFFVLGLWGVFYMPNGRLQVVVCSSWGITQWIVIVPLIIRERAKGERRVAQGLIITGCVGLLLSSACAGLFLR